MNKERLERMTEILENEISDADFNMAVWGLRRSCSTTGCALGWYLMKEDLEHTMSHWTACDDEAIYDSNLLPDASDCQDHFGISWGEYQRLFIDGVMGAPVTRAEIPVTRAEIPVTRAEMIERIRSFIKQKEAMNEV